MNIDIHVLIKTVTDINVIYSFCTNVILDNEMSLLLIVENEKKLVARIYELNLPFVLRENYVPGENNVDFFILSNPYDKKEDLFCMRKYARKIIVIYNGLYDGLSNVYFGKLLLKNLEKYEPDIYFFDKINYKHSQTINWLKNRSVELGNPKFDDIYINCKNNKIILPKQWEKLNNTKKIILWTTDHGVYNEFVTQDVTYDLYSEYIFDYFIKNQDVGLIFRPHPTFVREMLELKIWSENELDNFRKNCLLSPNIVFDENVNYNMALSLADGIMTDSFCGIVLSSLPLEKPICLCLRDEISTPPYEELMQLYYIASKKEDIQEFFNIVINEKDILREKRQEKCFDFICSFDGYNGYRIKEYIKNYI